MTTTLAKECDPWLVAAAVAQPGPGAPEPALRMPGCRRLVVVVAHPHEELGAAGGLLHDLVLRGVPVHQLALTAPVRRRKRRALMRLRVGGLTGEVEQVAPTEVFVGDLAPEGRSSRGARSRPPAATDPR